MVFSFTSFISVYFAWYLVGKMSVTNHLLNFTLMLQVLGKVYAVLADKDQRAVYDEQGIVDEESDSLKQDRSWEEHWRRLFPKVFLTPCAVIHVLIP